MVYAATAKFPVTVRASRAAPSLTSLEKRVKVFRVLAKLVFLALKIVSFFLTG